MSWLSTDGFQSFAFRCHPYSPTAASLKTIKRLVSSIHLILNPPRSFSYSAKAAWMSRVLSSGGKPWSDNILVTHADRDIWFNESDAEVEYVGVALETKVCLKVNPEWRPNRIHRKCEMNTEKEKHDRLCNIKHTLVSLRCWLGLDLGRRDGNDKPSSKR